MAARVQVVLVLGADPSVVGALCRVLNRPEDDIAERAASSGKGELTGYPDGSGSVGFNNRLLAALGGGRADWGGARWFGLDPEERADWAGRLRATLAEDHPGVRRIVLGDPRVGGLLPLYREALEESYDLRAVLCVGWPEEVSAARGGRLDEPLGRDAAEAVLVGLRQTLGAERGTRGLPRAVLTHDALADDWRGAVATAAAQAGIKGSWFDVEIATFDPLMVDEQGLNRDAPLNPWCRPVLKALESLSRDPDDSGAMDVLDEVVASLVGAEGDTAQIGASAAPQLAEGEPGRDGALSQEDVPRAGGEEIAHSARAWSGETRLTVGAHEKTTTQRVALPMRAVLQAGGVATRLVRALSAARRAQGIGPVLRKAAGILAREGLGGVQRRVTASQGPATTFAVRADADPRACLIVTAPHVESIARMMTAVMRSEGFQSEIAGSVEGADKFGHCFVLCPQMFANLPEHCIVFQMEQSVDSRWFTPAYLATLGHARAVLDYSLRNIEFLSDGGVELRKLHYLPLDVERGCPGPEIDPLERRGILFYGDINCRRRQEILGRLRAEFPELEVIGNLFGEPLREKLRSAAVVVNIHYYEGALLETARIFEALSHGAPVVSEVGADQEEHGDLAGLVDFVPVGDVDAMAAALRRALEDEEHRRARAEAIRARAAGPLNRFETWFRRVLLAQRMIGVDAFAERAPGYPVAIPSDPRLCLSLPETPGRRRLFLRDGRHGFEVWDGLKTVPGWVGAALSYKHMFTRLREAGVERAIVCEDDVLFPPDFERRLMVVERYLAQRPWDVFSGFIADAHPDLKVLAVEEFEGLTFVTIDRTVSMVFNIFGPKMMRYLADWDQSNSNVYENTIDRWIERRGDTRVVLTLPFLVGHRPDATSTIWDVANTRYDELQRRSEQLLAERVAALRARGAG